MIKNKLRELAKAVENDFIKELNLEYHKNSQWTHESDQYNDFIVMCDYRFDGDPSYHFTDAQTEHFDQFQDSIYADFLRDNKEKFPDVVEKIDYEYVEKAGLADVFCDYEHAFYYPAKLKLFITDKQPYNNLINIALRIEYSQSIMYGDYDDTLFEFNLSHQELLDISSEDFIKLLNEHYETFKNPPEKTYTICAYFNVTDTSEQSALSRARTALSGFDCLDDNVTIECEQ
jgi:hypothetical protein